MRLAAAASRSERPPLSGDSIQGHVAVQHRPDYLPHVTDPYPRIDDILAEHIEAFDLLGDWESRIEYVIDLGKGLAPLSNEDRIEANKVPGCAAQVWLASRADGGRLWFAADSDSHISKGNIALLLSLYSGQSARDILAFDARAALDRLGLPSALTRQRANGLNAMVGRIREEAAALA